RATSAFVIASSGHQTLSGLLMGTPAILTVSALTRFPRALGRILICAQTEERGLPELSVRGPLGVRDLADELWTHPRRIRDARRRIERRSFGAEPFELRGELGERRCGEARSDLPHVSKRRPVIEPDEKRAKMQAPAFRPRESGDHELGFFADLDLEP